MGRFAFRIIKIIFFILITIIGIIVVGFAISYSSVFFLPTPSKPEVKYGEFPFKLVYEIDGEKKEVEDVLICEYDGIGINEARGKYRKWKSHLASGNTRIILLNSNEIEIFYTPDIGHAAAVYMGDTEIYTEVNEVFPDAWRTTDFGNKNAKTYVISAEDMWNNYKLKLISWEITPPIKNSFEG